MKAVAVSVTFVATLVVSRGVFAQQYPYPYEIQVPPTQGAQIQGYGAVSQGSNYNTTPYNASAPLNATPSERDPHKWHVLLGMSAAPYILYDTGRTAQWYLGVAALPEIRCAYSLDKVGYARAFASVKWSALSTTTLLKSTPESVAAEPLKNLEFMGVMGITVVPSPEGPARSHLSSSVTGFSLGFGYGSARTSAATIIRGPVVMLSVDLELLAFNFM